LKGSTYKRCGCVDAAGKPLGADCPRLKGRNHGTWYYYAELPAPDGGSRRRQRRGGFATQRDAQAALVDLLDRVQKRTHIEVGRQSVGEYLDSWMGGKLGLRASTRRSYAEHIRLYLKPGLGHHRLAELATADVEDLYDALRQLGREGSEVSRSLTMARLVECRTTPAKALSAARIRRVHATLMSALNAAAKRRLIAFNPAAYVELESGRRPKAVIWTEERVAAWRATGQRPKVAVWTPEQTGRFLDHARNDRLYPLFHLVAFRGLRRGEAVGLPWTDVHLEGGTVTISEQIIQLGWKTERGAPKTDSGARIVALDADTIEVLREHQGRQHAERVAWGEGWVHSGLVFTREDGSALHPAAVTSRFERLVREADLPPIRLHDLRHGAATLALAGGANLKVVSEMLGHSSIGITADTYTSVLPEVARAAAEAAARLVPRTTSTGSRVPISSPSGPRNDAGPSSTRKKAQVKRGAPPGTRTPNPRIKSPLLCQLS
jgi:integrase